MRIAIRADASIALGSGHVMRCLTLAHALRARGGEVAFICRQHPGNMIETIKAAGYDVMALPAPTCDRPIDQSTSLLGVSEAVDAMQTREALATAMDWLVVDHYAITTEWQRAVAPCARRLLVIDDLVDRSHHASILLNQNLYPDMEARYRALVPADCHLLLGPRHALLRPEFKQMRQDALGQSEVHRVLVFFGGSDEGNMTEKALAALKDFPQLQVRAIIGPINPHQKALQAFCLQMPNVTVLEQVQNMASEMIAADLFLGASGSTTWERLCVGLPGLVVSIADNQVQIAEECHRQGLVRYLGTQEEMTIGKLRQALGHCLAYPSELAAMRRSGQALVDGSGAERVVNAMFERL